MDNLEKQLLNLPKPKLSRQADWKIKFKIYRFLLLNKTQQFSQTLLHPHSLLARVTIAMLVIVVFLGSTAVYAVNNDHITPGNTLYPLKKTIENVEQQLSLTKNSQVDTLNKLSERRLKEAVNLAQDDFQNSQDNDVGKAEQGQAVSDSIQRTINEAVDNLDSAMSTSQQIQDSKKAKKAKDNIKKQNEATAKYLDDIDNMAKQNKDEEVLKKVNEAKQKIDQYNKILDEDDRQDSVIKNYKDKIDQKDNQNKKDIRDKLRGESRDLERNRQSYSERGD